MKSGLFELGGRGVPKWGFPMLKPIILILLALAVVLMPFAGVPATAAQVQEDSLIDVWVFEDSDLNGVYSSGDVGYHETGVCIHNNLTNWDQCIATDYGDVWWEITAAGNFTITVDADDVGPDYAVNSIQCRDTRTEVLYGGCTYDLENWKTDIDLPYGTRINIFYALVEVDEIVVPEVWLLMFPMVGR